MVHFGLSHAVEWMSYGWMCVDMFQDNIDMFQEYSGFCHLLLVFSWGGWIFTLTPAASISSPCVLSLGTTLYLPPPPPSCALHTLAGSSHRTQLYSACEHLSLGVHLSFQFVHITYLITQGGADDASTHFILARWLTSHSPKEDCPCV